MPLLPLLAALTLASVAACRSQAPQEQMPPPTATPAVAPAALTYPDSLLTGRFDPSRDTNFVRLPDSLTDADGAYLLHRDAAAALTLMVAAAEADGVALRVRSATRNHERQAQIWTAKWTGARTLSNGVNLGTADLSDSAKARMILLYSSMPGTSRHHWGTDVDFNAFENDYFDSGRGAEEYAWLREHGPGFGFFQPYTSKDGGRTGYEEERWHWSYGPLSRKLLAAYREQIGYEDIGGFPGAEVAREVRAIEEYVYGVDDLGVGEGRGVVD